MPMGPVTKEVLPNGLTILVAEETSAPVVAINLWVRAGYFDEDDREIGISHVIEHMFFKGTHERPRPDQIATEIKDLGGELNAGTYYDSTNYHVVLPAENFRRGLAIQADALMHPLIEAEELQREIEAVIQEGRRKIDTPGAFALETLYAAMFDAHRLRRWRIGREEGLRALTRDDLLRYVRSHYVPARVILAVAGDVRAAEAIEAAHVYLGGMETGEGAPLGSPPEPRREGFRHRRIRGDIRRATVLLGFRAAPILSDDDYALRVLAHVLGAGRSSRLFQAVKERLGLVESIGAATEAFRDVGVFTVSAECDPKNVQATAAAVQAEIERLRREPPSDGEIERARAAIEFRYHQNRSEALGRSAILAYFEALGDHALADEAVRRLNAVTAADVRRAAEAFLTLDNATLLEYLPESYGEALPEGPAVLDDLRRAAPAAAAPAPEAARRPPSAPARPENAPRLSRSGAAGTVTRHVFETGTVLLHEERRDLPIVTFGVAFRGGRSGEGRETCGITRFMQATMIKGSTSRDARQVALEIEGYGSAIERVMDEDYFGFALSILSRSAGRGFAVLADLIRRPAFRHEEIERERALLLAAQESIKDQSLPYTFQLFRQAAFGSHPYALPSFGHQAAVAALKREDLVKWHRFTVRPATMVVTVVGDLSGEAAIDLVGKAIAEWGHEGHGGRDPGQLLGWGASEAVETRRRRQTAQVVGFPTPGLLSPERYPLDLIQSITSGLGGRFFEAIRGRRGLAYAVHAFNYHRVSGGAFAVYLATSPGDEAEARRVLFQEIARLRREGPRRDEVDRAVRFARGGHAIAMQSGASRAFAYLDAEVRGLGAEAVQAYPGAIARVGHDGVADAIWRYLDPDHCALGILRGEERLP